MLRLHFPVRAKKQTTNQTWERVHRGLVRCGGYDWVWKVLPAKLRQFPPGSPHSDASRTMYLGICEWL